MIEKAVMSSVNAVDHTVLIIQFVMWSKSLCQSSVLKLAAYTMHQGFSSTLSYYITVLLLSSVVLQID